MNHTEGPWKAGKSKESGLWHIHGGSSNGEYVCCLPDKGRGEANANLIAAAPKMLEALKEADGVICELCKRLNPQHDTDDYGKGCEWCSDREDRLQALAKAEEKPEALKKRLQVLSSEWLERIQSEIKKEE